MGTHKVYLTEEQWARVCKGDSEITTEVTVQQPELAKRLGYELVTVPATSEVKRVVVPRVAGKVGTEADATTKDDDSDEVSPVSEENAHEAIEKIGRMTSKPRLQHVIDNDKRSTVQEAARKRLEAIES